MDSGLLSRWCMCINSHWCSRLCKVKNSLKIVISHQGFFFSYPFSVPSQNRDFELSLARLLVSCDMSELALRLLRNISVLLNEALNKKSLLPNIWCPEHKCPSITTGLISACLPCSPVLKVFPLWVVLNREDLLPNLLFIHSFICSTMDFHGLCSQGLLQIFSFLDNY